jgi:hypothetical protein
VVRTLERFAGGSAGRDHRPSMAADVQEGSQLVLAVARDDYGDVADPPGQVAGAGPKLLDAADVLPGTGEDSLTLSGHQTGIGIGRPVERLGHGLRVRARLIEDF